MTLTKEKHEDKKKLSIDQLPPIRQARSRALMQFVLSRGQFLIDKTTWKAGWTFASLHRAAEDLAKAGLVTIEAGPNGLYLEPTPEALSELPDTC